MTADGSDKLGWGLLATGFIAAEFARAIRGSDTGHVAAVASRDPDRAAAFAAEHEVAVVHGGYQALLEDPNVDVVYVATPHSLHSEWTIKAADAGKHVLCEKPLALNQPEAAAMIEAARRNDVFLMEGFMYRTHPQTQRLVELLRDGAIGRVELIDVAMSFWADAASAPRLVDPNLGGGAILDVGCYCTSMALLVAAATGRQPPEPIELRAHGYIDPRDRVDHFALASMRFDGDLYAQLSCGVRLAEENRVRIHGDEGAIELVRPCWVSFEPEETSIVISPHAREPRVIRIQAAKPLLSYEVDHVAAHIHGRQSPAMSWDESLRNMRTLDRWREAIGRERDAGRDVDSTG
jgi:predicted dehydrogenase